MKLLVLALLCARATAEIHTEICSVYPCENSGEHQEEQQKQQVVAEHQTEQQQQQQHVADKLQQQEEGSDEKECCSRNTQELAAVHRNLSALWYTVAEFREVVARHLHHLHEHQVLMFNHQMSGNPPPLHSHQQGSTRNDSDSQYRSSSRRKRPYSRRRSHSRKLNHHHHQQQQADPFHGLDRDSTPRAFAKHPAVRNPEEFDLAICHMRPNTAVPDSRVHGHVLLYQKKDSEILYLHLMLSGFAPSVPLLTLPSLDGPRAADVLSYHGLHVHEKADFSTGCDSTGPHYNPKEVPHGGPHSSVRHVGDFGNVASDSEGAMHELITDGVASLRGEHAIYGKPLVVHGLKDDLGANPDDPGSASTGNSGPRLACCTIEHLGIGAHSLLPQSSLNEQVFTSDEEESQDQQQQDEERL